VYYGAPESKWIPSPARRPAVTLTFDFHNLTRSSVGAIEYSVLTFSKTARAVHEIAMLSR